MIYEERELRFKLWQMLEPQNKILQKCTIKYDEVTSLESRENQVNTFVYLTMKMVVIPNDLQTLTSNCRERFKDVSELHSCIHNLSSCEIKA